MQQYVKYGRFNVLSMRVSIFFGNSLLRCMSTHTPLEIFVTRNFVCGKRNCVTVLSDFHSYSYGSLSRVKKHGNCFSCVYAKFVRIEPFSYFRNFLIHSVCYRFWIQIFIENIGVYMVLSCSSNTILYYRTFIYL